MEEDEWMKCRTEPMDKTLGWAPRCASTLQSFAALALFSTPFCSRCILALLRDDAEKEEEVLRHCSTEHPVLRAVPVSSRPLTPLCRFNITSQVTVSAGFRRCSLPSVFILMSGIPSGIRSIFWCFWNVD
jgi:hypothetical protein